jgi:hypothetical protein
MTGCQRYTLPVAANRRWMPRSSLYGKIRPSLLGLFDVVYTKEGPGRIGTHNTSHEHSSPSLVRRPPPSPLPLTWPPESLYRSEITPPLHAVVVRSFRIPYEAIYFRNLGWIGDSRGRLDHRICVSTRRCCHLWHHSHCAKFFNDLEVGYVGFIINACVGA